jgi:MFS family permease
MTTIPWTAYRRLDRRIFVLAAMRGINTMGFSIVMPFMAMYLVEQRGVSGAQYGAIYLVAGLAAAAGNAASGEASDRLGRRRVMICALLGRTLNMCLLGTAVVLSAPVWVMAALIVLNAVLRATFEPAASAAVTELAGPELRTAAYGLQRIGVNLGWALGPALGGTLAAAHSYGTLFFFAAAVMLAAAVGVTRVEDRGSHARGPERGERPTFASALRMFDENRPFFAYLSLVLLGSILTVQQFATLSVYAKTELHLTIAEIGYLYAVNGLLVVVLQIPAVRFIDQGGPARPLLLGPLLYVAAFVAIGVGTTFPHLVAAMVVLTAGEVVFAPALTDMAARLGDPRRLGRAFGLFGLMQQIGLSIGPLVGGLLFDAYRGHPLGLWGWIAAAMVAVGVGYALFWATWGKRVLGRAQLG